MRKLLRLVFVMTLCAACFMTSAAYSAESFRARLAALDGVVSIDEIVQSNEIFAEKYIVWFEHPLDWQSPDIGTFLQRVEIGFQDYDSVNVMRVNGYFLNDAYFPINDRNELAEMYNANFINVEYRFFGKSAPEGLSHKTLDFWEYLTNENASTDFHNIMEQLRGILSGTWVFTGGSKGGQATNLFSYYYPDDADAYVAYVAPFCDGYNDERLIDAVYTTIGNERYGTEQAKKYRDTILDFQVEAVRNRDYLQPKLVHLTSEDVALYPFKTESRDFDEQVLGWAVGMWQYHQNMFASVDAVLQMPREDDPDTEINEREQYLEAMTALLKIDDDDDPLLFFPYQVQAAKENGAYSAKFKYLREALARVGLTLEVSEEDEKDFSAKTIFTDEQRKIFKFDPYLRNELINWSHTTESNVIMIYGNADPWYFVRLPDVDDNPNVHRFVTNKSHSSLIKEMPQEQRQEVVALLNAWLEAEAYSDSGNHSSSSGCNAGALSWPGVLAVLVLLKAKRKAGSF